MSKPLLMGILNVTPDSFSDGGLYLTPSDAIDAALRMVDEGADIIDVGGESTRPGSLGVEAEEELWRVLPVVKGLAGHGLRVSIDTSKAVVAGAALKAGAEIVNDVTALGDPDMAPVCAAAGCTVCLMHMKGSPRTMQQDPTYEAVVSEVRSFLLDSAGWAESQGIEREKIWIDPGIGFGKTDTHNLELIRHLGFLVSSGYPVLLGVSRKGFIGRLTGGAAVDDRLEGTLAIQAWAQIKGVSIIRTHDVRSARRTIDIVAAVQAAG